jgi:hypothetical protein
MSITANYGWELKPTGNVPFQNGDTIIADGKTYNVTSVTTAGRIKTQDGEYGVAELARTLLQCSSVRIERESISVNRVDSETYNAAVTEFQEDNPELAAFLTIPVEADEYYLTESSGSGFAIDGDTLVGLFNYTDDSGVGEKLVGESIKGGAKRLDCFDTDVVEIYKSWGFEEYDRVEWDEDLSPDNWDYETYGRPDVVFMRL